MANFSDNRRDAEGGPGPAVVACVRVESRSASGAKSLDPPLWGLAVRRMEGCLRPGDWMCALGAGRLAVCFGNGAHNVTPQALGTRLARAIGEHLSVGTSHLDLGVTVGVATGPAGADRADLVHEALGAVRPRRRVDVDGVPTVVVSQVRRCRHSAAGTSLARRTTYRLAWDDGDSPLVSAPAIELDPHRSDLSLLVIGPPRTAGGHHHGPAVAGVLAVAERVGVTPRVTAATEAAEAVGQYRNLAPDVVVIPLRSPSHLVRTTAGATAEMAMPWELAAQMTRALVQAGATVLAVGVGATVAAIAACVREGAHGVLDLWEFAEELDKLHANLDSQRLVGGDHARNEVRDTARPSLPHPYEGLLELTASEHRVLYQMMRGDAASEIAQQLVVSIATVRSHIRSILRKLGVSSQLAAVAIANGVHQEAVANDG
ncbi:MAG TPA: LuxR C-terminal-related transcriptional regulator [Acidimicrobiales bacterium]|nr:LuxR C-terminal-related transcriptional regulator [Acidimicrobiales bacterium]